MEGLDVLREIKNPLFKRREFRLNIKSSSSPKRSEVRELLAKEFSVPVSRIKIKNITGKFGSSDFIVEANVYESEEAKNFVEFDKKGEEPVEEKTSVEEVKKEESQNKELANPDKEPTQVEKSEEKENA